jgi:hypothetical protein
VDVDLIIGRGKGRIKIAVFHAGRAATTEVASAARSPVRFVRRLGNLYKVYGRASPVGIPNPFRDFS